MRDRESRDGLRHRRWERWLFAAGPAQTFLAHVTVRSSSRHAQSAAPRVEESGEGPRIVRSKVSDPSHLVRSKAREQSTANTPTGLVWFITSTPTRLVWSGLLPGPLRVRSWRGAFTTSHRRGQKQHRDSAGARRRSSRCHWVSQVLCLCCCCCLLAFAARGVAVAAAPPLSSIFFSIKKQ